MTTNSGKQVARRRPAKPAQRWFPDEGFYSMQADQAMAEMAGNRHLPTTWRLYGACAARANRWGHAGFYPGELDKVIGCKDDTRRRAMQTLKSGKIIAPESTTLCIVLSALIFRRSGQVIPCFEPKHRDCRDLMWVPSQDPPWERVPGEWHGQLQAGTVTLSRTTTKTRTVTETETETETAVIPAASFAPAGQGGWDRSAYLAAMGRKRCDRGHEYPATQDECHLCAMEAGWLRQAS
jgi:hypothetical protein